MRVLLTAFGPFGEHEVNASIVAARRVAAEGMPGLEVEVVELPVARDDADAMLLESLTATRPDALVMLGINERSSEIHVERIAINVDDYRIPDNRGAQPRDSAIVEDGPAAYFSTLPVRAMVDNLQAAGIDACVSNSAGTYLCNHVFYLALHQLGVEETPCRAGFVHVPQMSGAAAPDAPSMPLDEIVAGVKSILSTVSRYYGTP